MGKAIFAMIATVLVGFVSCAVFANWVNAPSGALFLRLL